MPDRRKKATVMAALATALALVLAGQIAVTIPGFEVLGRFPSEARFGRAIFPGSVPPLSQGFLASVFGSLPDTVTATDRSSRPARVQAPSGPPRDDGRRTLDVHPLTNDDFTTARVVARIPYSAKTDASRADRDPDEPRSCAPAGATVWYRYRPTRDQSLFASTTGSKRATSLGVYTGSSARSLDVVGCDTEGQGNARVPFTAEAGRTYHFQITTPVPGSVAFNLDPFGVTRLASATADGDAGNDASVALSFSADGRYVAFDSAATDLVPEERNDDCLTRRVQPQKPLIRRCFDVFVLDTKTRALELVSVSSTGEQGDDASYNPEISADGRFISFSSVARNLVPGDTNDAADVFVRDRVRKTTTRVSVSSTGAQGNDGLLFVEPEPEAVRRFFTPSLQVPLNVASAMSADGRYVAFVSRLTGLVSATDRRPADRRDTWDVFLHDRKTRKTTLVPRARGGSPANSHSLAASISDDGRFVAYASIATNLVTNDRNECVDWDGCWDVFVTDTRTGRTERASVSSSGREADGHSGIYTSISGDGRYVAFDSTAANLVPEDTEDLDVFVHDRRTRRTTLVSISPEGDPHSLNVQEYNWGIGNAPQVRPMLTADGRFVVYAASSTDESHPYPGVFLHDRHAGTTVPISVTRGGSRPDGASLAPAISAQGNVVGYVSSASNLVERDDNSCPWDQLGTSCPDVFFHVLPSAR